MKWLAKCNFVFQEAKSKILKTCDHFRIISYIDHRTNWILTPKVTWSKSPSTFKEILFVFAICETQRKFNASRWKFQETMKLIKKEQVSMERIVGEQTSKALDSLDDARELLNACEVRVKGSNLGGRSLLWAVTVWLDIMFFLKTNKQVFFLKRFVWCFWAGNDFVRVGLAS